MPHASRVRPLVSCLFALGMPLGALLAHAPPVLAALAPSSIARVSPDERALLRARGYVAALNAGDAEAWGRFRLEAFADVDPSDHGWRARYEEMHARFGSLSILDEMLEPDSVLLVLAATGMPGAELHLRLQVESGEPFRIVSAAFTVEDGGLPSASDLGIDAPPIDGGMSDDALRAALGPWLDDLAARDILSGVVRLERDGVLVFEHAYGFAEKSYRVPNRVDTPFRIGSIAKTLLQVALATEIAAGHITPETTVAEVLPDYPDREAAARISVRHLAEHTSGLAELRFGEMREFANDRFRRPEDYFAFFADDPLLFEPGSAQRYSNSGYIVLGAMLEVVGGERWEELVRRAVLVPAGTTRSGSYALDRVHDGVATGYWKCEGHDGPWCSNTALLDVEGTPSGGGSCTALDLSRISHALQEGRLLDDDWTHWVYTGEWPGSLAARVDRSRWHGSWAGGAEGVNALVAEERGMLVVVLSNHDEPAGEVVGVEILNALVAPPRAR